jgi:uncharacterized membrane protein
MFLRLYKYPIVITFIIIFIAKMIISGTPVIFKSIDKNVMNAVIMQIELEEEGAKDCCKDTGKFTDFKLIELNQAILSYNFYSTDFILNNKVINYPTRYIDPYHPLVPTPPPNLG